jgi:hypothetical protein
MKCVEELVWHVHILLHIADYDKCADEAARTHGTDAFDGGIGELPNEGRR